MLTAALIRGQGSINGGNKFLRLKTQMGPPELFKNACDLVQVYVPVRGYIP